MPKKIKMFPNRGSNKNSHGNNKKTEDKVVFREVGMLPHHWELVEKLSKKSKSEGMRLLVEMAITAKAENIDQLFAKLPHIGRAKIALQMLLDGHPQAQEYGEAVLIDLEDLEIKNLYEEAVLEGKITLQKGAWIV